MRPTYTIPNIFQEAARSRATHKKNLLSLRKLACQPDASFQNEFFLVLCRILNAKKGNVDADNVLKFCQAYFEYLEKSDLDEGTKA